MKITFLQPIHWRVWRIREGFPQDNYFTLYTPKQAESLIKCAHGEDDLPGYGYKTGLIQAIYKKETPP